MGLISRRQIERLIAAGEGQSAHGPDLAHLGIEHAARKSHAAISGTGAERLEIAALQDVVVP